MLPGSVHRLGRNVPHIPGEIDRFAPCFAAVELPADMLILFPAAAFVVALIAVAVITTLSG